MYPVHFIYEILFVVQRLINDMVLKLFSIIITIKLILFVFHVLIMWLGIFQIKIYVDISTNVENQNQMFWIHSKIKVKACLSGTGLPWMEHTILRDGRQMHINCTSFYILEVLVHFVRSSAPLGALHHRSYVY